MSDTALPSPIAGRRIQRYAVPAGRALLALIFILSGPNHFSSETIGYAAHAGVPLPGFLVPAAGVLALVSGLSVALGYRARLGALGLIAFLVPVTLMMHAFWAESDPMMHMMQRVNFLKNVGLLGGALLVSQFGAGPTSLDARHGRS